jgi:hypothetical protein
MSVSTEVFARIRSAVCAIGYLRIPVAEYRQDPTSPAFVIIGTGFVVAPGLVLTNRHVLMKLRQAAEKERIPNDRVLLQFTYPTAAGTSLAIAFYELERTSGTMPGEEFDVAMIGYNAYDDDPKYAKNEPLTFETELDIAVGQPIACVGFPFGSGMLSRGSEGGDLRFYRFGPVLQQGYISAIAPYDQGLMVERILLDVRTSPGMSGSPVFDSGTGSVIGIHDAGREATTAFAIPLDRQTVDILVHNHTTRPPTENAEIVIRPVFLRRR